MAESQYSADSAHDPDAFPSSLPHPLTPFGRSRRDASLFVGSDGDPDTQHPFAPVGINVPADVSFTSITLHG